MMKIYRVKRQPTVVKYCERATTVLALETNATQYRGLKFYGTFFEPQKCILRSAIVMGSMEKTDVMDIDIIHPDLLQNIAVCLGIPMIFR